MKHTIAEIQISYKPNRLKEEFKITHSEKAFEVILENWDKNTIELYEEFKVLLLNNSNIPLGIYTLGKGGITSVGVDIRLLFAIILKSGAVSFITVHNHPSLTMKPSKPDIDIFKKIKKLALLHNLNYLDNLLISPTNKFSFMDEGY